MGIYIIIRGATVYWDWQKFNNLFSIENTATVYIDKYLTKSVYVRRGRATKGIDWHIFNNVLRKRSLMQCGSAGNAAESPYIASFRSFCAFRSLCLSFVRPSVRLPYPTGESRPTESRANYPYLLSTYESLCL